MKRSEVNKALRELEAMCQKYRCYLPPFCHFTPEEWETKGHEYDEVRDCCLGWDITDYGQGNFDKIGFSLITIRNGSQTMREKYPKVYAEKLLFLKEGQYSPNHFHWYKTEDIINLGFSHQVNIPDTEDCTIVWQDPNHFTVTGIDKQKVGQYAAEIRAKKPPEPYKGKGIRYEGEVVKHKEGKAGKGKK